jgi:PPM family protein phosphatase
VVELAFADAQSGAHRFAERAKQRSQTRGSEGHGMGEHPMQGKVEIAVKSDVGKERSENQDHFGVFQPTEAGVARLKGALVVVADGMGGHSGGKVASETAVDAILAAFKASQRRSMRELLEESVVAANDAVRQKQQQDVRIHDCGTTAVCLMVRGKLAVVAHLGDSRCYLFRGDKIQRVTRDHTYLNELIDIGILTAEQAQGHPDRNIITRCVGMATKLDIDFNRRELQNGDILLMCSDGLSNFVTDEEMAKISRELSADKAGEKLVQLANDRGGEDNITVAIVKVHDVGAPDPEIVALDADESAFSAKITPVIKREDLGSRVLGPDGDSEMDTAENIVVPADALQKTRETKIGPGKPVTTAQPLMSLMQQDRLPTGTSAREMAAPAPSTRSHFWYWIIGLEILVLLILQFLISRY